MDHSFRESDTNWLSLPTTAEIRDGIRLSRQVGPAMGLFVADMLKPSSFTLRGTVIIAKDAPFKLKVIVFATTTAYIQRETRNTITFYVDVYVRGQNVNMKQRLEKSTWLKQHSPASTYGYYDTGSFYDWRDLGTATFALPRPRDLNPLRLVLDGGYMLRNMRTPERTHRFSIPITVTQKFENEASPRVGKNSYYNSPKYYENPTKWLGYSK
jgi:hypothetical protein